MELATSRGDEDSAHLLKILPTEIWLQVVDSVTDPEDLENISNSSIYLRELLRPRQTQFLFKNVVRVMGEKIELDYARRGENDFQIYTHSDRNDLLDSDFVQRLGTVRSVCKYWNVAVDSYLREHKLHFLAEDRQFYIEYSIKKFVRRNCHLSNGETFSNANKLLNHFATTHQQTERSPFFGNSIEISVFEQRDAFFETGILTALKKYGGHITHCSIEINSATSRSEYYIRLFRILGLVPNLKTLRIKYLNDQRTILPSELNEFRDQRCFSPLPNLTNLEMITTYHLIPAIVNELMRSNPQVKNLEIIPTSLYYRDALFKQKLTNLTTLSLSLSSSFTVKKMNSALVNWQLKELTIDTFYAFSFIPWQELFDALNAKFSGTLTVLNLRLPEATSTPDKEHLFKSSHLMRLTLPRLEELTVCMKNVANLDFILPSSHSVHHLDIRVMLPEISQVEESLSIVEDGPQKRLHLFSCIQEPDTSNVWSLFPKLCTLYVTIHSQDNNETHWFQEK